MHTNNLLRESLNFLNLILIFFKQFSLFLDRNILSEEQLKVMANGRANIWIQTIKIVHVVWKKKTERHSEPMISPTKVWKKKKKLAEYFIFDWRSAHFINMTWQIALLKGLST